MDPSPYDVNLVPGAGLGLPPQMMPIPGHPSTALSNQLLLLQNFWQSQLQAIEHGELDFKNFQLPLARIKKVMKTDDDVKMISAEAPIIFAKACEIFILELTLRSWLHTEDSKRRTLQRSDVSAAIQKTDTFDFLIDIVPREDTRSMAKKLENDYRSSLLGAAAVGGGGGDPASYYMPSQMAIQQQLQMQNQFGPGMQPPGGAGNPSTASMEQLMYYQQHQQSQAQLHHQMQMMQRHQLGNAPMDPPLGMPPSDYTPSPPSSTNIRN